jgi:predicted membrane channel-forming protein YqfA (hemolysin III family)
VLTQDQNAIIYLMFLSGILLLGLNSVAYSMVFPGSKKSKRLGYMLFIAVAMVGVVQQAFKTMVYLGFPYSEARQVLLLGFVIPFFLVPIVYYRLRRNSMAKSSSSSSPKQNQP